MKHFKAKPDTCFYHMFSLKLRASHKAQPIKSSRNRILPEEDDHIYEER